MKKIFSILVALVASVGAFAQQEVGTLSVAPKAGINLAYMTKAGDDASMKLGFVGGVDLTYQVAEKFAISGGLFYSQQGVKGKGISDLGANLDVKFNNDYFNVPILANYYVAPGLALKAGVQLGTILSAKIKAESGYAGVEGDVKDSYNSLDVAIPVGLSYEVSNFIIDARYNFGLTNTFKEDNGGTKNSVIMLTVGYKINL